MPSTDRQHGEDAASHPVSPIPIPGARRDRVEGVEENRSPARVLGAWVGKHAALLIGLAIGVVVGGTGALVYANYQMKQAPDWWTPIDVTDPAVRKAALDVENGLSGELTRRRELTEQELPLVGSVRASENWGVRLESGQASAWLTERLPKWAEAEGWLATWPEELAELRLNFDGATIRLGARVRSSATSDGSYMTATLTPQFRGDGTVWLIADSVSIGRLPLPPAWVFSGTPGDADVLPSELAGDDLKEIFSVFLGDQPAPDPLIRLGDGRRVRLVGIQAEEQGTVLLIFRTEYVDRG